MGEAEAENAAEHDTEGTGEGPDHNRAASEAHRRAAEQHREAAKAARNAK